MPNDRLTAPALFALSLSLCGCGVVTRNSATVATGGDPGRGATAISRYGCGSCHNIPGIVGAHGLVGPPLGGIANRLYIAGVLPNEPVNLISWVQDPRSVDEKTVMPNLGVRPEDATDIAAYLYSLK